MLAFAAKRMRIDFYHTKIFHFISFGIGNSFSSKRTAKNICQTLSHWKIFDFIHKTASRSINPFISITTQWEIPQSLHTSDFSILLNWFPENSLSAAHYTSSRWSTYEESEGINVIVSEFPSLDLLFKIIYFTFHCSLKFHYSLKLAEKSINGCFKFKSSSYSH